MIKRSLVLVVIFVVVVSCKSVPFAPAPTPLPGWDSPVADLFVEISNFPGGWSVEPNDGAVDPRSNHVSRTFFNSRSNQSGIVIQDIWRAYSITDAEEKFAEVAHRLTGRGWLPRFPSTSFGKVSEVIFESKVAEKWGTACGVDVIPECYYVALYHNYVTQVYFTVQLDGFERFDFDTLAVEKLLAGVESKFSDHLQLQEITPNNPAYLSLVPTPSNNYELREKFENLYIRPEALPDGWEAAFKDWSNLTNMADGAVLGSRNYSRDDCYIASPSLRNCYLTQFVAWYPKTQSAMDEWQRKYTELNVGDPSPLGVWRIPDDIRFDDSGADQSFVACSEVAGGEDCEAILRFGNYWIAVMAEMQSVNTIMGHTRSGLTHSEFGQVVEKVAAQANSVVGSVK